jgi:predicted TIM-barrel fold metal-dependent hydrolase
MVLVDAHAHIFAAGLPLSPFRRFTPGYDATIGDYLALLDRHGVAAGVLVQPSFLGTDNSYLLAGLAAAPARLRGIAVIDPPRTGDEELAAMKAAGIVGVRLNLIGADAEAQLASWDAPQQGRVAALGWQIEVQAHGPELPRVLDRLDAFDGPVVVDHFGRPAGARGLDDPGFRRLLEAGPDGRLWVKLSAAYRLETPDPRPYADALLARLGPARLLWGSDWPWTQHEDGHLYANCLAQFESLCPSPALRAEIGETARRLFGFAPTG